MEVTTGKVLDGQRESSNWTVNQLGREGAFVELPS